MTSATASTCRSYNQRPSRQRAKPGILDRVRRIEKVRLPQSIQVFGVADANSGRKRRDLPQPINGGQLGFGQLPPPCPTLHRGESIGTLPTHGTRSPAFWRTGEYGPAHA